MRTKMKTKRLMCMLAALSLSACGVYEDLTEYTGPEEGDPCGPCERGEYVLEECSLGELEGLIAVGAACASIVHVDAASDGDVADQDGSAQAPFASLEHGLEQAGLQGAGLVLVAGDGDLYSGRLVVGSGVHVLGGYASGTFEHDAGLRPGIVVESSVEDAQVEGLIARSIAARTVLARLTVRTSGAGLTHLGALLEESPALELRDVSITAGPGGEGEPGEAGGDGSPGGSGQNAGISNDPTVEGAGGVNDRCDRVITRAGIGGVGAIRSNQGNSPARGGGSAEVAAGGLPGSPGEDGEAGQPGVAGDPGALPGLGSFMGANWAVEYGEAGSRGTEGRGGGGGGGGEDSTTAPLGGGGGGGGAGGCPGEGGAPGSPSGSSFGALIIGQGPVFGQGVEVNASSGGAGVAGGVGGVGGAGGAMGLGAGADLSKGGDGGAGGAGGAGGDGSPGAPGHSVGVWCLGSEVDVSGISITHGDAGAWSSTVAGEQLPEVLSKQSQGCAP